MTVDPHVIFAHHITVDDETGRLTVEGRRPGGHPTRTIVDCDEMDDLELHWFANAVLHVLYRRFPREARLIDRTHEGAK